MTLGFMLGYVLHLPSPAVLASSETVNTLLGPFLSGLVGLAGLWFTTRQARRASKTADQIEARRVDAEAYERAQEFTEFGIEQLRSQLVAMKQDLQEKDTEVRALRVRVRELEDEVAELRRTARRTGGLPDHPD